MSSTGTSFLPGSVEVRLIGGPTALIEMGGVRLLTDPTFDPPGDHPVGNRVLVKTHGPAVAPDGIGPVDAVLLSHDQHPDNLDDTGRRLLDTVPVVLTTGSAASRIGGTTKALAPWRRALLPRPAARAARILDAPVVIPLHVEGWKHFTQGPETIAPAFARHGATGQLRLLAPGESTTT